MKTKNYLIAGASLIILTVFAAFTYAQSGQGEDEKKARKIEKRIEVNDENGAKTVKVTTIENGVEKVELLKGEAAEKFLSNEEQMSWKDESGEKKMIVRIKEDKAGSDSDETAKVIIMNGEEVFMDAEMPDLDSVMKQLAQEMEKQGVDMKDLQMNMNLPDVKWCYKINDGELTCLDGMDGEMEFEVDDNSEGNNKKIMIKVMVSDDENNTTDKSSVKDEKKEFDLKVFPNPSAENVIIEFDVPGEDKTLVTISDMNGKVIYKDQLSGQTHYRKEIKTGKVSDGIYFMNIDQGDFHLKEKMVIKH